MNYSTKLSQSFDAIRALANPLDFAKIEELIDSANTSVQPYAEKLLNASNMLEISGASLLGTHGTLSVFFDKNNNGEVKELAINFTSYSPVGRDLENNIVDFKIREFNPDTIAYIKPGKSFLVASLSHKRNTRSNREYKHLSRFSVAVKKEASGKITIVSSNAFNPSTNQIEVSESC